MPRSRQQTGTVDSPEQRHDWFLKLQGEATEVFRKVNFSKIPPATLRGKVTTFSRQSRMRMLRYVAHVNWAQIGKSLFVTLTYPPSRMHQTAKERSMQRYVFLRYAEKHLQEPVRALWRLEWKPRLSGENEGEIAPHFHLLLCGIPFIRWQLIRKWWRSVLKVKGPLCTDVQGVKAEEGAALYCAKYTAKDTSLDKGAYLNNPALAGRHWGVVRKSGIPTHPIRILRQISEAEVEWCQMIASGVYEHYDPATGGGFTLLGREYADRFFDEFSEAS